MSLIQQASLDKMTISEEICFICQDQKCNNQLSPCGHTFCYQCTAQIMQFEPACPICFKKIDRLITYEELSYKPGVPISPAAVDAVLKNISGVVIRPYHIVSIVGKLNPKF